jgi:hypothetical protein
VDVEVTEGGETATEGETATDWPDKTDTTDTSDTTSPPRSPERLERLRESAQRHPRLMWAAALVVAALGLYWAYLRQSQTLESDSDPAAQALQAWSLLHGNLLLDGWWLGDVWFYTVEIPLNAIIEAFYGLRPGEVHIAAGMVYAAVVLLSALLARGNARGWEGIVRALLGGGIMLAPSLVDGTRVLLQGPDHVGTAIPILVTLLVLDRATRERWWVPVAVGAMLTWGQLNDPLAMYAAALPVALVCGIRACSEIARRQWPPKERWYDTSMAVAALLSIGLAHVILARINAAGGFYVPPPRFGTGFAQVSAMPAQTWLTIYNVLILFGADFIGQQMGLGAILAIGHLVGVALGVWALWIGLRGFFSRIDRINEILVAGTIIVLAAGMFGNYIGAITGAHEIFTVLPFCAVLAGRLLGPRLIKARLELLLALGLVFYLGALAHNDVQPVRAPWHQDLAVWLESHNLTRGLAPGGESDITTLDSGGRIRLAPLTDYGDSALAYESDYAWFNPAVSQANFVVAFTAPPPSGSGPGYVKADVVRARFGPPARSYRFDQYTIMVYNYNLLTRLTIPTVGGFKTGSQ